METFIFDRFFKGYYLKTPKSRFWWGCRNQVKNRKYEFLEPMGRSRPQLLRFFLKMGFGPVWSFLRARQNRDFAVFSISVKLRITLFSLWFAYNWTSILTYECHRVVLWFFEYSNRVQRPKLARICVLSLFWKTQLLTDFS